jgi:arylesterase/paraoxonase
VLPAASTVVHDVKTGNLWLSGFASKFITVCEPKVG